MAIAPERGEPSIVGMRKAVASFVEERKRLIVFSGSLIPAMQFAPDLKPEHPEIVADRSRVRVTSFQLAAFDEQIANHLLGGRTGWGDP